SIGSFDRLPHQTFGDVERNDIEVWAHDLEGAAPLRASDVEQPRSWTNRLSPAGEGDRIERLPEPQLLVLRVRLQRVVRIPVEMLLLVPDLRRAVGSAVRRGAEVERELTQPCLVLMLKARPVGPVCELLDQKLEQPGKPAAAQPVRPTCGRRV